MPVEALNQVGQNARDNVIAGLSQPTAAEGEAAANVLTGLLPEITPESVQPATDSLMAALNAGMSNASINTEFATSLAGALATSLTNDDSLEALAVVGDGIWNAIWAGIKRSAEGVPWDGVLPIPPTGTTPPAGEGTTGAGETPLGYAKGTRDYPGGLGLVGEFGAELVRLPRGSTIYTAEETKKILAGMGQGIAEEPQGFRISLN